MQRTEEGTVAAEAADGGGDGQPPPDEVARDGPRGLSEFGTRGGFSVKYSVEISVEFFS